MRQFSAFILLICLALAGCSSLKPTVTAHGDSICSSQAVADSRLYQIYIGSGGELLDPEVPNTYYERKHERCYVDNILRNVERMKSANPAMQLVVFIHGGLNTFEKATERVDLIKDEILKDGKYPLFISWDSGFPGNYADHLLYIRRGLHSKTMGRLSSPFVLLEDITRSIVRIPASTYNVFFGQRSSLNEYESSEERASRRSFCSIVEANQFHVHSEEGREIDHFLVARDTWSIINPLKLLTAPFVDGFGTGAWDSMLRRTDLVLRKRQDFDGRSENSTKGGSAPVHCENKEGKCEPVASPGTAAALFLSELQDLYVKGKETQGVVIAGHSMGTIIANNIVAKYPRINFSHIVYMAAATRMKDVEYVIAPYMNQNKSTHFYNITLHPYWDIMEGHSYDSIPRGSLLMWIDQTLGDVNSFQDRTAGFWYNFIRSANQIFQDPDVRKRVHLTQYGLGEESPSLHGDFSKHAFWQKEFWTFNDKPPAHSLDHLKCEEQSPRQSASK